MEIEKCTACANTAAKDVVLWDCLPVPCFGDLHGRNVQVVTLSLNPSSFEFFGLDGQQKPAEARLPMATDYPEKERAKLSEASCREAGRSRNVYFARTPHSWFTPMQMMLRSMNLEWSYREGTAVQIDIVACATKPSFGDLEPSARDTMIKSCKPHLQRTLANLPGGTWVIINGATAIKTLESAFEGSPCQRNSGILPERKRISVSVGEVKIGDKKLPYFGWNIYLHRASVSDAGAIIDYWKELRRRWPGI